MTDPSNTSGNNNVPVKKSDDSIMALITYVLYLVFYIGVIIGPGDVPPNVEKCEIGLV